MQKFWIVNKVNKNTAEILLYGYIDPYDVNASDFVKELRSLEKDYSTINVRINSGGGSVFEGFAIFNAIRQSSATINTYIDGLAASMASIIAVAGKKVYISKVGQIMTHQPSTGGYGTSEDMRKNAELLDALEKALNGIYASKTGLTLDDSKTKFMNGKDNWFNADQAIVEKLADEIYDAEPISLPSTAISEKDKWSAFNTQRFAAIFNPSQNEKNNMEKIFISAASLTAIGITGATDQTAVDAKIADLVAKSAKVDDLTSQLTTATTKLTEKETELATIQATHIKAQVSTILSDATREKKITVEMRNVLATQYETNPEGLKALVATLKPFESIVKTTEITDVQKTEVAELMKMSGLELFNNGKLDRLKELNADGYKVKYKEAFGSEPAEETK
jgi:ATP-dependent Clp protease protease subunit